MLNNVNFIVKFNNIIYNVKCFWWTKWYHTMCTPVICLCLGNSNFHSSLPTSKSAKIRTSSLFCSQPLLHFVSIYFDLTNFISGMSWWVSMTLPFMYGWSGSGIATVPSAFWCVSNRAISILGTAQAVPFSVCACNSGPGPLCRYLMLRRRDW